MQEKGKFKLILPQAWASSFWQSELKDVFIMWYLTPLKSLFWSQSVRSLFDCMSLLAFPASSSYKGHSLIMCVCFTFTAWSTEKKYNKIKQATGHWVKWGEIVNNYPLFIFSRTFIGAFVFNQSHPLHLCNKLSDLFTLLLSKYLVVTASQGKTVVVISFDLF